MSVSFELSKEQWWHTMSNFDQAVQKINSFRNLKLGWCYGKGGPISENVIEHSLYWLNRMKENGNFITFDAFSGESEILISGYFTDDEEYCDLTINLDGTIDLLYEIYGCLTLEKYNLPEDELKRDFDNIINERYDHEFGIV